MEAAEEPQQPFGFELQPTEYPPECPTENSTVFATVEFLHTYGVIAWPNFTHCLPNCGICQPSSNDQTYLLYNLFVIGFLLPFVSFCGLFGNGFSAYVYSRPAMRSSTNSYLCALGCSDNAVILTAVFLFFVDSVRRYSLRLNILFNVLSPYVYPAGMIAQTCSVYFTLTAATDCFIHVCLPMSVRRIFDNPRMVRTLIFSVLLFSILYNLPHCYESVLMECWHTEFNSWSVEVCPAPFRFHATYLLVYYKYMYSIFLAVGPLIALIFLNTCIVLFSMVLKRTESDPGDNMALILVVLLFISCNTIALLINIFETHLSNWLSWRINYIIDVSNLLVVFNSSFNFVIYYRFSKLFRLNFKYSICERSTPRNVVMSMGGDQSHAALLTHTHVGDSTTLPFSDSAHSLGKTLRAAANKEVLI